MKRKERVHNHLEGKVLVKESLQRFDDEYQGSQFFTHDGDYLFTCVIDYDSNTAELFNCSLVEKVKVEL